MTSSHTVASEETSETRKFLVLLLGSVGVVYGDIGTSPLYAFREALRPFSHDGVSQDEVVGLISLMVWTLTIIVTFKYVLFLLRADNDGEGGTLSLLALLMKKSCCLRPSGRFGPTGLWVPHMAQSGASRQMLIPCRPLGHR